MKEIKKYMEANETEKRIIQNLCHASKAVLTGKYTAIQAYLKVSNIQPNLTPEGARKVTAKKPSLQKKGNNNDQSKHKLYRNKKNS